MSQQIQELIDKIKSDGIQKANEEAKNITEQANKKAKEIVDKAQKEAEAKISDAKAQIKKQEEASKKTLEQASRDMLLSLRKNINTLLKEILSQEINSSLTPDNMAEIIGRVIEKFVQSDTKEVTIDVAVSKDDLEKVKGKVVDALKKKLKNEIRVDSSADISSGFTISFDAGKSCFDFSDASLAEYLSAYVNDYIAEILKNAVSK